MGDLSERYKVKAFCYDPQYMAHAAQNLEDEGLSMVEWRQNNERMVPATRTLYEAVTAKRLRHGGDATARLHALNAAVRETERESVYERREPADPAVLAFTAHR